MSSRGTRSILGSWEDPLPFTLLLLTSSEGRVLRAPQHRVPVCAQLLADRMSGSQGLLFSVMPRKRAATSLHTSPAGPRMYARIPWPPSGP